MATRAPWDGSAGKKGKPPAIDACAHAIRDALSWDANIVYQEGSFKGADFKSLDASRFLSGTGFSPKVNILDGLRRVLVQDYAI